MFRLKILISFIVFSSLLIGTSFIKNETREIEKFIAKKNMTIYLKEKDFNETQLDFFYLTSPSMIEDRVEHLDNNQYFPMEYSKIFLNMSSFIDLENKLAIQEKQNDKKTQKK